MPVFYLGQDKGPRAVEAIITIAESTSRRLGILSISVAVRGAQRRAEREGGKGRLQHIAAVIADVLQLAEQMRHRRGHCGM